MIRIRTVPPDTICVRSPFVRGFAKRARELGGQWDHVEREWDFHLRNAAEVRAACRTHFGTDGRYRDYVTVELVARRELSGPRAVSIAYVNLATKHARGRGRGDDRDREGVAMLAGTVRGHGAEGGPIVVEAGTRFRVRLPSALVEGIDESAWTVEPVCESQLVLDGLRWIVAELELVLFPPLAG